MFNTKTFVTALSAAILLASCSIFKGGQEEEKEVMGFDNKTDSLSYSLGMSIANNLKQQGLDTVSTETMSEGFNAAFNGDSTKISLEEANQVITQYFTEMKEKQKEEAAKEGREFLQENAKREGVQTTSSGLQYEVLEEGEGEKPDANDKVTVHYKGTLLDGTVFDSSYDRGQPASFGLNQVIKGWTEGLQLMKEGAKYKLFVPYDLAYGERGAGGQIPGYATLIFEVELLDIEEVE